MKKSSKLAIMNMVATTLAAGTVSAAPDSRVQRDLDCRQTFSDGLSEESGQVVFDVATHSKCQLSRRLDKAVDERLDTILSGDLTTEERTAALRQFIEDTLGRIQEIIDD